MADISLENYKMNPLYPKVVKAIGLLLQEQDEIATLDVLIKIGNITPKDYEAWRRGKIAYLERVFQGSLSKAGRMLRIINFHMHDLNMVKTDKPYKELNGKRVLRFSKFGIQKIEEVYSRQFRWNRSQEIKKKIIEESISSKECRCAPLRRMNLKRKNAECLPMQLFTTAAAKFRYRSTQIFLRFAAENFWRAAAVVAASGRLLINRIGTGTYLDDPEFLLRIKLWRTGPPLRAHSRFFRDLIIRSL